MATIFNGVKGTSVIPHKIDLFDYYELGNSENYMWNPVEPEKCIKESMPQLKNKKIIVHEFSSKTVRVDEENITIEFVADFEVVE